MIHKFYSSIGIIVNEALLTYWRLRDKICPPSTDTVLFVAHPDDDALFFHSFIKEKKPYVAVLFTGWSIRRLPGFIKTMKHYQVKYRIYPEMSAGAYCDENRRDKTRKRIDEVLCLNDFNTVVTHNSSGEYGHNTHKLVNETVVKAIKGKNRSYRLFVTEDLQNIDSFPLDVQSVEEKKLIFNNYYKTESWVMTDRAAGTPIWFYNEHIREEFV